MTTSEDNTAEKANYATGPVDWEATAEMWKERAAVLRERVAELEAVIEKVRGLIRERTFSETLSRDFEGNPWPQMVNMDDLRSALTTPPSEVLAAVRQEAAAEARAEALREADNR